MHGNIVNFIAREMAESNKAMVGIKERILYAVVRPLDKDLSGSCSTGFGSVLCAGRVLPPRADGCHGAA